MDFKRPSADPQETPSSEERDTEKSEVDDGRSHAYTERLASRKIITRLSVSVSFVSLNIQLSAYRLAVGFLIAISVFGNCYKQSTNN